MDASMAGYLSLFPSILWMARPWISDVIFRKIFWGYMFGFLAVCCLALTSDLEIFPIWGHRVDSAILPYLQYPAEAFASVSSSPLTLLVCLFLVFFIGHALIWKYWAKQKEIFLKTSPFWHVGSLILTAAFIIPIRGGFQLAPMNQSSVYFSSERILNQAAENGIWVLMQSIVEGGSENLDREYVKDDSDIVNTFFQGLKQTATHTDSVLRNHQPNIVLIVWESLTSKVVGSLGGKFPSTPNLDKMAKDGILFTRMYASGDRSDKGLAALLASVPALGKISIMAHPNLSSRLQFLNQNLKTKGYNTGFLYGGDLEFANMKSFMLNAGFDKLIGKSDFPKEMYNSKWGAHDEALFQRQIQEASSLKQPFFQTLFTLTSHEPFEVPGIENKANESVEVLFQRSHRYTDRCLADWNLMASKQDWWKNTLVIVVADHGHALPGLSGEIDTMKFKIPMVWYGPALAKKGIQIPVLGSQTDLFKTLMVQLGDSVHFPETSNDLLSSPVSPFAFYSFRNGSVFLQGNKQNQVLDPEGATGSASRYRQWVYSRFYQNKRSKNP